MKVPVSRISARSLFTLFLFATLPVSATEMTLPSYVKHASGAIPGSAEYQAQLSVADFRNAIITKIYSEPSGNCTTSVSAYSGGAYIPTRYLGRTQRQDAKGGVRDHWEVNGGAGAELSHIKTTVTGGRNDYCEVWFAMEVKTAGTGFGTVRLNGLEADWLMHIAGKVQGFSAVAFGYSSAINAAAITCLDVRNNLGNSVAQCLTSIDAKQTRFDDGPRARDFLGRIMDINRRAGMAAASRINLANFKCDSLSSMPTPQVPRPPRTFSCSYDVVDASPKLPPSQFPNDLITGDAVRSLVNFFTTGRLGSEDGFIKVKGDFVETTETYNLSCSYDDVLREDYTCDFHHWTKGGRQWSRNLAGNDAKDLVDLLTAAGVAPKVTNGIARIYSPHLICQAGSDYITGANGAKLLQQCWLERRL